MKTIRLHQWPYAIFRSSRTPPGLYARQKWLQEASSPRWKAGFDATVSGLFRRQSNGGLLFGSPIETIHHLFGLHPDGAWGETDRQWCKFLTVHALRNKGLI